VPTVGGWELRGAAQGHRIQIVQARSHQAPMPRCRQLMLTAVEETLELAEGAASNDPEVGLRAVIRL
jgi:hypothetical protein